MDKFQPIKKQLLNDKLVISIRIEETKLNEIDKLASLTDISRNELINNLFGKIGKDCAIITPVYCDY